MICINLSPNTNDNALSLALGPADRDEELA